MSQNFPLPPVREREKKGVARLRRLLHFLFQQLGNDLADHLISQRLHLIRELRLDRVWYQDWLVLRHSQSSTLGMRCANELGGGNVSGRDPLLLKVDNIVRTARDAAPSIAQGFDDSVTLLSQFCLQRLRHNPPRRRLPAAQDIFDPIPPA